MPELCSIAFDLNEAQRAADEWGFNCGPAAICAVTGITPAQVRPHLGDFERKGYTNPTLMYDVLTRLGVPFATSYRGDRPVSARVHLRNKLMLMRVQWAGRWTDPGVPMQARYRHTHWVAVRTHLDWSPPHIDVFDVNAMCAGGWLPWDEWANELVPWLLRQCEPKATGQWWPTHVIDILRGRMI